MYHLPNCSCIYLFFLTTLLCCINQEYCSCKLSINYIPQYGMRAKTVIISFNFFSSLSCFFFFVLSFITSVFSCRNTMASDSPNHISSVQHTTVLIPNITLIFINILNITKLTHLNCIMWTNQIHALLEGYELR